MLFKWLVGWLELGRIIIGGNVFGTSLANNFLAMGFVCSNSISSSCLFEMNIYVICLII